MSRDFCNVGFYVGYPSTRFLITEVPGTALLRTSLDSTDEVIGESCLRFRVKAKTYLFIFKKFKAIFFIGNVLYLPDSNTKPYLKRLVRGMADLFIY
jgi:hypothetical protein